VAMLPADAADLGRFRRVSGHCGSWSCRSRIDRSPHSPSRRCRFLCEGCGQTTVCNGTTTALTTLTTLTGYPGQGGQGGRANPTCSQIPLADRR
jgi:hypothetical protein